MMQKDYQSKFMSHSYDIFINYFSHLRGLINVRNLSYLAYAMSAYKKESPAKVEG